MRETCVYTTLAIVCGVSVVLGAHVEPRASMDATVLDSDAPIARRLSAGELHRYHLRLAAAEFARVVIEQQGVDVVVQVRDADGREVAGFEFQLERHGIEPTRHRDDGNRSSGTCLRPEHEREGLAV